MLALMVTLPAATAWANGGWSWRVDVKNLAFVDNPKDYHKNEYGGNGYRPNTVISIGAKNSQPSFFIFGDSYAQAFATGLFETVAPIGKSGLALFDNGCLIGPSVTRFNKGVEDKLCSGEYDKVLSIVKNNNYPVFISHSWDSYNGSIGNKEGTNLVFEDISIYRKFVLNELDAIVDHLGNNRKIILIGTTPGDSNKEGLINCIQRPSYMTQKCKSSMNSSQGAGYELNLQMEKLTHKYLNVFFWNPYDIFCEKGSCNGIISNKLMYSDAGHLSKSGSRFYFQRMKQEFLDVID